MNIDNKITDNADAKTTHDAGEVVDKKITSELIVETKSDADATTSDLGAIQGKNMYAFLLFMMIIIII
jgi:hypothetical protein